MNAREELLKLMGIDATGLVLNLHRRISGATQVIRVDVSPEKVHDNAYWFIPAAPEGTSTKDMLEIQIEWELWRDSPIDHRIFYSDEHDILFIAQVGEGGADEKT